MFEQVTLDQIVEMASRAGKEIARKYPGIDSEDIASEALTALMGKIDRVADMSPGYLYEVLRRDGLTYAAKQRYQYVVESNQYIYTPREVKALLEHCYYDPAAWDVPTGMDDWLSAEIDGHSIGVSLFDIKAAMERIKPTHRNVIEQRYFYDDTSIHHETVNRAVDSLVRALNRKLNGLDSDYEGPGSRQAVSNGEAVRRTSYEMSRESYQDDALEEYHKIVAATAATESFQDPPGTHYDWDKYNREETA